MISLRAWERAALVAADFFGGLEDGLAGDHLAPCDDLTVAAHRDRGPARPALLDDAQADILLLADDAEARLKQIYGGRRVLLVEDEPVNQEIACMLLEDVDLLVDVANDGVEAVERASQARYDLILMDMQMPRLDGLQATRLIRHLPDYERTPIVAMTANAFAEDKERCLAAGMSDFIAKPVNPEVLFAILFNNLEQSAAAQG